MTAITSGGTVRQPIFGRYGSSFLGSSPGRAEQRRGKYANAIINKVKKRKRIDRDYALVRSHREGSDSESDGDESRPRSREKQMKQERKEGWFASTFNYIESHPNLPNVLSIYAQMAINFFIAGLTVFGVYTFWMTVRADVDKASDDERALLLAEITKCATDYVDNRCGSDQRLPALQLPCQGWEHCMRRDPDSIGRARVSAHTFAQIFNSFIEPISYKAMVCLLPSSGFYPCCFEICSLHTRTDFCCLDRDSMHSRQQPRIWDVQIENCTYACRTTFLPTQSTSTELPMGCAASNTAAYDGIRCIWRTNIPANYAKSNAWTEKSK